jgi:hypothetical protein
MQLNIILNCKSFINNGMHVFVYEDTILAPFHIYITARE